MTRLLASAHPTALVVTWVMSVYADTGTPVWALWRPLIVAVLLTITVQAGTTALIRHAALAAFVTSAVAMLATGLWLLAAIVAVPPVLTAAFLALRRWPRVRRLAFDLVPRLGGVAGVASIAALGSTILSAADAGAFWDVSPPQRGPSVTSAPGEPDIYVLMLDGYPRADTLADLGIDVTDFQAELGQRGFTVAPESRSSYSITWLTLASMFQMDYVHRFPAVAAVPERGPEQYRVLGQLVNENPVFDHLRARGFRIVASPPPFSEIAIVTGDVSYPTFGRTWFETELLAESPLSDLLAGPIRAWAGAERREALDVELDRVVEVATRPDDDPTFMFAHVVSPHAPFVFRGDGSSRPMPECHPSSCVLFESHPSRLELSRTEFGEHLGGQVTHLNARLLDTVDAILAARPDAIVVLMSDHGARYDMGSRPEESTHNFVAARTPGHPNLFGAAPRTVNLMATILNAYLDGSFPIRDPETWISRGYPLQLEPLPPQND